jgi:hypothetical protein
MATPKIKMFAISESEGREEIDDLYWFEENGVHDFETGEGHWCSHFTFEIFIGDKKVYPE